MYKVLMYGLLLLAAQGIILSIFGVLPFSPIWISLSLIVTIYSCYLINIAISRLMGITVNSESAIITGLILFLIIQPASKPLDLLALFLVSLFAMSSKYLLVANRIHILNPAATAALLSGLLLNYYATWWVGSEVMFPLVLIVGLLVIKKVRRFTIVGLFILTAVITATIFNLREAANPTFYYQLVTAWPIVFFASIMLTEPLTMPGTRYRQIFYAILIGVLFGSRFNIGPIYSSPELALVLGNLTFFILGPRNKYLLVLKGKVKLSPDIYEFFFKPDRKIKFTPGQYIEWTLGHDNTDSRGNRRFFTIASSPTEDDIKLGIRMNNPGSSFKNAIKDLNVNDQITAAQVAGDFVLDISKPAVFVAGGIGITPFRSMIKYLLDKNIQHEVHLFYLVKKAEDFVFKDVFDEAAEKIGLKIHYIVSDTNTDFEKLVKDNMKFYSGFKYYLSGPSGMVDSYKEILHRIGVPRRNIITDYFPGF